MTEPKTSAELLEALSRASQHTSTAEELHAQRISFIMGAVNESNGVTRDRVEEILAVQEGRKAS